MKPITQADLESYLDEELDAARSAEIEQALRDDAELLERLGRINARRSSGVHTLGEIWRRYRIGVPSREDLGSYLLGVLPEEYAAYIKFRVDVLRCPYTIANLQDLEQEQAQQPQAETRRDRYYRSSIGYLGDEEPPK